MKKVMSLIVILSMLVMTLTACGEEKVDVESAFKIGGIGPATGDAAVYGLAVENGATIAIEEINAAGGANGFQLEFNFQDDEHNAEKAVNAYNTLKDWDMQMLMGTVTSTPCVAVAAEAFEDRMFLLTPSASSEQATALDNAFSVCFTDTNQGIESANYIADNQLATKVAVIYNSSDVYSSGIYEKFLSQAQAKNIEVVATEAFTADSSTDFSIQLQKAKESGADLVFLPIYNEAAALILIQADAMGYEPSFFGCDGIDGILALDNFDTSLAEDMMLLTPFAADAKDELTVDFVTKYQEQYEDIPNQFAANAYDAIYILKAAIEEGKVTPDMSIEDTCDALSSAMIKIKVAGLTGPEMTWIANGEVNKAPKAIKIIDGVYTGM